MKNVLILYSGLVLLIMCCSPSKRFAKQIPKVEQGKDPHINWKLIWEESFEASGYLDTTKWSVIKRNKADWGNYMSDHPECMNIKNGKLYLRGIVNTDLQALIRCSQVFPDNPGFISYIAIARPSVPVRWPPVCMVSHLLRSCARETSVVPSFILNDPHEMVRVYWQTFWS